MQREDEDLIMLLLTVTESTCVPAERVKAMPSLLCSYHKDRGLQQNDMHSLWCASVLQYLCYAQWPNPVLTLLAGVFVMTVKFHANKLYAGCYFCWLCNKRVEGYEHFREQRCVLFDEQDIEAWNMQHQIVHPR